MRIAPTLGTLLYPLPHSFHNEKTTLLNSMLGMLPIEFGTQYTETKPDTLTLNETFSPSCTKGSWTDPQRFFKHNSASDEPKLAKFLLIQVQ